MRVVESKIALPRVQPRTVRRERPFEMGESGRVLTIVNAPIGYGDVTPKQSDGRFIPAVVMLAGLGFLAVITASVTASLVESSRRRFAAVS